jgi:2-polyprenyl-3-methyl-5-hydroxy-6-metoxy-1,4-benzoquinol methylase
VSEPTDTYTHGHRASVVASHARRTVENSAAYLRRRLTPGSDVLDVGCGPGSITIDLARLVAPGRVVGVENVEEPLTLARGAASEAGTEIEFRIGDAYALDFPDASFDVVHAHQVLQHLTDPVAALREMSRVCRPGGVVAVRDADYAAMTWYPELDGLAEWLDLYRAVALGNRAQPDAGRRLLAWARAAGFGNVVASASVWLYATPEERRSWGYGWAERTVKSGFARQARERGLATESQLAVLADGWRRWADSEDGWFTVLHGEVLWTPPAT